MCLFAAHGSIIRLSGGSIRQIEHRTRARTQIRRDLLGHEIANKLIEGRTLLAGMLSSLGEKVLIHTDRNVLHDKQCTR